MKTLLVCYIYLHEKGGGAFAAKAYINAFAHLSETATLVYKQQLGLPPSDIDPKVKMVPVVDDAPRPVKLARLLAGKLHPFRKTVESILAEGGYDTVVFTSSICSLGLIDLAHSYGCKVITIHHNCEYDYYKDNTSWILRPITLHWTSAFERAAILGSDQNLMLTSQDVEAIRSRYGMEVRNPAVLGVFEYKPSTITVIEGSIDRNHFVITGRLSDMQTRHSLESWAKRIFPTIWNLCPDSTVTVAGKDPSDNLCKLLESYGCKVIASPSSMDDILHDADFYINPVDMGSGLKLRNMDGLRYGLPIICHDVSARGYEEFQGKVLFSYHDLDSFRDAVRSALAADLDRAGVQAMYTSKFSFESGVSRLRRILSL